MAYVYADGATVNDKAQLDQSDELGWALDRLLEHARGGSPPNLCPKAIARAHARLLNERAAAARAERQLGRIRGWALEHGAALCPNGHADTFGDGMRSAKAQVSRLLGEVL